MEGRISPEKILELIITHLNKHGVSTSENMCWKIGESPLGDRGLFATRDIAPGEIIFVDHPLIVGPRAALTSDKEICVACYTVQNLTHCSKNCGLLVCSKNCEESFAHKFDCERIRNWSKDNSKEVIKTGTGKLTKCLTPLRALNLNKEEIQLFDILIAHVDPRHGFEIDILKDDFGFNISEEESAFLRKVCAVLDANSFELIVDGNTNDETNISLRGLYTLASLANHNCVPNTMHVFDYKKNMIVRATVAIKSGEEIFHSYIRLFWGTLSRRYHLLHSKHFACTCSRCKDPTEFGTYFSAVLCQKCRGNKDMLSPNTGLLIPINPLKSKTHWRCCTCGNTQDNREVAVITTVLGSRMGSLKEVEDIVDFLRNKCGNYIPTYCNQIAIELKYQLVWNLGYKKGYSWRELSEDMVTFKETICMEILQLLEKMGAGECKMKGLLIYELLCSKRELRRRAKLEETTKKNTGLAMKNQDETGDNTTFENLLNVSSEILLYDVGAPSEIKSLWKEQSIVDLALKQSIH